MSRERALKIKAHLRNVVQRNITATPSGMELAEKMPVELGQFLEHVVGNAAMVIDMALDSGELVEASDGRPVVWANVHNYKSPTSRQPIYSGPDRKEVVGEICAVELPPNCSIHIGLDLLRGDAPAPAFIRIGGGPDGNLEVKEVGDKRPEGTFIKVLNNG